jgi:hypothetical protein
VLRRDRASAVARYSGQEKSHGIQNGIAAGWLADRHHSTPPSTATAA